jgi:hypothetical protein
MWVLHRRSKGIAESKEERQDTYVTRVEGWSKEGLMSFTD